MQAVLTQPIAYPAYHPTIYQHQMQLVFFALKVVSRAHLHLFACSANKSIHWYRLCANTVRLCILGVIYAIAMGVWSAWEVTSLMGQRV